MNTDMDAHMPQLGCLSFFVCVWTRAFSSARSNKQDKKKMYYEGLKTFRGWKETVKRSKKLNNTI